MNLPVDPTGEPFRYTPDEDNVKIHQIGAIRLICAPFQSHEAGLPEWIKNSADEYARQNIQREHRIIIVFLGTKTATKSSSISVLDFGGMTSDTIEKDFRQWADPEASTRSIKSSDIQGGHGNGGKCYMTMMFAKHSLIHTVKSGRGNRYGVKGGSFQFGYIPTPNQGRNFKVNKVSSELDKALQEIGSSVTALPQPAREALKVSQGFTLVTGFGPKGYNKRTEQGLIESLKGHPQMIKTLHFCDVFVMVQGRIHSNANPLVLESIDPHSSFSSGKSIRNSILSFRP